MEFLIPSSLAASQEPQRITRLELEGGDFVACHLGANEPVFAILHGEEDILEQGGVGGGEVIAAMGVDLQGGLFEFDGWFHKLLSYQAYIVTWVDTEWKIQRYQVMRDCKLVSSFTSLKEAQELMLMINRLLGEDHGKLHRE